MPKKDVVDEDISEIKKLIKTKKLVIGTGKTIKNIMLGNVDKVFLSSNCPKKVEENIEYYKKIGSFKIKKLGYPNDEIGALCKKPFFISVLSVLKGGK